jgi:glycosyltransferase involved in cell wall biosynthesis
MIDHTFVVPAYGRSRYLEACLASLRAQTAESRIVVCTSTPFAELDGVAARYGAETFAHAPNRGIGHDWNMALAQSRSEWTTIAHQDDVYHPTYASALVAAGGAAPDTLIVFSDYAERARDERRADVPLLNIKRRLLELGFLGRRAIASRGAKRRALAFGSPIACPAVTYHRRALDGFRFREDLKVALDWAAWLDLAARPGAFVWVRDVLMEHRIHDASETSAGISDGTRRREDLELLTRIWPQPIARLILASYERAYAQAH